VKKRAAHRNGSSLKSGTDLIAVVMPALTALASDAIWAQPDFGTDVLKTALVMLVGTDSHNCTMCHFITDRLRIPGSDEQRSSLA